MNIKKHFSYPFMRWPIHSFEDAIYHNIKFLRGEYISSPYHAAPIYDMNNDTLLLLHENGILTVNGQSDECYYKKFLPKTEHQYYNNNILTETIINDEKYINSEQKSYIDGFIKETMMNDMKKYFDNLNDKFDAKILYKFTFNNNSYTTNIHQLKTWLTRESDGDEAFEDFSNLHLFMFENFNETFKTNIKSDDIIHFFVTIDKPCDSNVENLLARFVINRETPKKSRKSARRFSKKNIKNSSSNKSLKQL